VTFEVGRWDGAGARRVAARSRWSFAGLFLTVALSGAAAQEATPGRAFSVTNDQTLYPLRDVGGGVFVVQGDSGQGAEGRPNAGFVETDDGIVVVGGLASPAQARAVIRTIRTRSERPIRWLVLYAHHPDMMFGAIEMRRAGAKVIAHPDTRVLAAEGGPDAMVANWHSVVGLQELLGFEYADQPDWPVTGWDTLRLGGEELVVIHPGPAHSAGDLMFWLPGRRVLFSGDILVEDGITMVVDGNSQVLLATLALIDSLAPKVLVPGHGRIPEDPAQLVALTRGYITALRDSMRAEVRRGTS
jgi:glyoxylase-like metal-dependent hydrolase (beta-lactamase superfamily II)